MKTFFKKIFGSRNQRLLNDYSKIVSKINALEPEMQRCSDEELRKKTEQFQSELLKNKNLDELLPRAFAVVREASVRTIGQRHFDVQLIGGLTLHFGKIAEMKTGEGKTLV